MDGEVDEIGSKQASKRDRTLRQGTCNLFDPSLIKKGQEFLYYLPIPCVAAVAVSNNAS